MTKQILILGVNGFIGSTLVETILRDKDWIIYGMDMSQDKIEEFLDNPRFHFKNGDITVDKDWVNDHIIKCDVVLPLVAIANPLLYVKQPLKVFDLDFEANHEIIKRCVETKTRIIFPSTSEVYGMSQDDEFSEETSNFVLGPIDKQRWIYSCIKQLLDRLIYAHGVHNNLDYTLFRPFNFLGPKLDSLEAGKKGFSRVVTQFISDIIYKREIKIVDGGSQRRSFTDITEGVEALVRIIENKDGKATRRIFNIGNPKNDHSIKELADAILRIMKDTPQFTKIAEQVRVIDTPASEFYGSHYQDTSRRVPSIKNAQELLGWEPTMTMEDSLKVIIDHFAQVVDDEDLGDITTD